MFLTVNLSTVYLKMLAVAQITQNDDLEILWKEVVMA
jgi:hypothetical protein